MDVKHCLLVLIDDGLLRLSSMWILVFLCMLIILTSILILCNVNLVNLGLDSCCVVDVMTLILSTSLWSAPILLMSVFFCQCRCPIFLSELVYLSQVLVDLVDVGLSLRVV